MQIDIAKDYETMSERVADFILTELKQLPSLLFCASAGGTPTRPYERLAVRQKKQPALFKKMRVMQIDEWVGVTRSNSATCWMDLKTKLLAPLAIESGRFHGFKSDAADPQKESARMAQWLERNGPIDICILGLGLNGHIAMNDPADALLPHAHVSKLASSSRQHSMLAALKKKPRFGFTLGVADILSSRCILLLVNGGKKRAVLKRVLESPVTTRLPASFLHLHPNTKIFCDRASVS